MLDYFKKIGVISDTHGLLRPETESVLKSCDYIIHAGDIDNAKTLEMIRGMAPLTAVRGNNDRGEWAWQLPLDIYFELEGIRFYMVHDIGCRAEPLAREVDVIIYGHSHCYDCEQKEKTLWLNPGSCGRKRFYLPITMAVIYVSGDGRFWSERIDFNV